MIDVALVGCGAMGRRHALTIAAHPECRLVAVLDRVPERAAALAAEFGAEVVADVPPHVVAVVIATPTTTHGDLAAKHLAAGHWVLVEKPLAASRQVAAALPSARLAVAHSERFNPAVRAVAGVRPKQLFSRRFNRASPRGRDVDVVLDLMVHDLDLLLWWTGESAVVLDVDGDWDRASVRLRTDSGVTAELAVSRIADVPERAMAVVDGVRRLELDLLGRRTLADGVFMPPPDDRDALQAQWDAFVDAVCGRALFPVDAASGIAAVGLAEQISASIRAVPPVA